MRTATKALVLQGGGALGSYQGGVYQGLFEKDDDLDWVAGVSIGAINAALIAGNAPARRIERLTRFWDLVSSGPGQGLPGPWANRTALNQLSAASAMMLGVPGFFRPRADPALLLGGAAPLLSYYDTSPLRSTLESLVDFDRINHRDTRLSVGAVNVRTGNSVYFDNTLQKIGVEHIMASCALPPGFAPVRVGEDDFWDGGIVSNTPLQYVLDSHPRTRRLVVLQVDLFSARGAMPATLSEVTERQKDIVYSSRTRMNTDVVTGSVNLQQAVANLISRLPPRLREQPDIAALQAQLTCEPIDIIHLIYRDKAYELDSKDYEFSRATMTEHWDAGMRDVRHALSDPEWLLSETANGVTTFDLTEPKMVQVRRPAASLKASTVRIVKAKA
ncbi:MAG TPA: patatin-like phospholipase family protein [Ramlibacter sp.]|nr:patatin-like phospholipase family protein [Ramlibacter sp.]